MTHERSSQDPHRPGFDPDYRNPLQRLEDDLQMERELTEGRASSSKIGLLAISILALQDPELRAALERFREHQTSAVLAARLP